MCMAVCLSVLKGEILEGLQKKFEAKSVNFCVYMLSISTFKYFLSIFSIRNH